MRHGPPARDDIPSLHSDGEALPEVACLSGVTSNDRDTPAELGDKLLTLHPPGSLHSYSYENGDYFQKWKLNSNGKSCV